MPDERQRQYLDAMGISLWTLRRPLPGCEHPPAALVEASGAPARVDEQPPVPELAAAMTEPSPPEAEPSPSEAVGASQSDVATLDWGPLEERVAACTRCGELVENRTRTVFGVGNRAADWLVIGEAPGAEEDRQGEPFVGPAGKLLDAMLGAISLDRGSVYIANALKCHPPKNRDPRPEEADNCRPYLERQIDLVAPKLILVVGPIAAQNLLQTDTPLAQLRGQVHRLPGREIPVIVTYHPAHLLRNPGDKRKAWEDLKLACQVLASRSS